MSQILSEQTLKCVYICVSSIWTKTEPITAPRGPPAPPRHSYQQRNHYTDF